MKHEHATTFMLLGVLLIGGVLAGRLAARLRLPAMTGHLLAGFAIGTTCSSWLASATVPLVVIRQGLGGVLLFWIGSQLTLARVRECRRVVASLMATVFVSVAVCAFIIAVSMTRWFDTVPLGELTTADILLAALVLSATSPTVIAVISQEQRTASPFARSSLDATAFANAGLLLLIVVTLGFTAGVGRVTTLAPLGLVRDLSAGLAVGGTLGVHMAFGSRTIPGSVHVAFAAGSFLLLNRELVHSEAAIMAGSCLAGVIVAHSGSDRPTAKAVPRVVPMISPALFVVVGALIEMDALIAVASPALFLFLVRAASLWLGARVAGGVTGDALVRRFGFAPLLPQAGFSLVIVGVLDAAQGLSAVVPSLVVAVVVMNELAMPPIVHFAMKASSRCQVAGHASPTP